MSAIITDVMKTFSGGLELQANMEYRADEKLHRTWEKDCRRMDLVRRQIDGKIQQLKNLANVSALIGGFAMIGLVQIVISKTINIALLVLFASSSSIVVCLMLFTVLNSTLMLINVIDFDYAGGMKGCDFYNFNEFWECHCRSDFELCKRAFKLGCPTFLVTLAETGFVVYAPHASVLVVGSVQAAISLAALVIWYRHVDSKWGGSANAARLRPRGGQGQGQGGQQTMGDGKAAMEGGGAPAAGAEQQARMAMESRV